MKIRSLFHGPWTTGRRSVAGITIAAYLAFTGYVFDLMLPDPRTYEEKMLDLFKIKGGLPFREEFDDGSVLERRESGELVFEGIIDGDAGFRLAQEIRTRPQPTKLVITTPGGSVRNARRVGWLLHHESVPVVVNRYCNSACIWVLLQAPRVTVILGSHVILHRPVDDDGAPVAPSEGSDFLHFAEGEFRKFNVDPRLLEPLYDYDSWPLTIREMLIGRLADSIFDPASGEVGDWPTLCQLHPSVCDSRGYRANTSP